MRSASLLALALLVLPARAPAAVSPEIHAVGFPLLFAHRWGTVEDGRQFSDWSALVLLWRHRWIVSAQGAEAVAWSLFPLISHRRSDSGHCAWTFLAPVPLAHFSRGPGGQFSYLFPALWYRHGSEESPRADAGWAVLPLAAHDRRRAEGSQSSTLWVLPFLSHETRGEDGTQRARLDALFPFFRHVSQPATEESGAAPPRTSLWGALPFTWGWRAGEFDHFSLIPLVFWKRHHHFHIVPFFWWGEGYLSIAPLWGRYRARMVPPPEIDPWRAPLEERFEYFLFPLWVQFEQRRGSSAPFVERHVLWPIFAWGDGGGRTERRVFPLWRRGTQDLNGIQTTSVWALFPLYWHGRRREGAKLLAAHDVLFPLFWDIRTRRLRITADAAQPVVAEREGRWTVLFPLGFRHAVDGQTRGLAVLWPLYVGAWLPEDERGHGAPESTHLIALLNGYQRWANGDWQLNLAGPLFNAQRRGPELSTALLWPLFVTQRDRGAGTARVALLWRLFEYTREGGQRRARLLCLPWRIPLP